MITLLAMPPINMFAFLSVTTPWLMGVEGEGIMLLVIGPVGGGVVVIVFVVLDFFEYVVQH
jgi:hypothetical protein